MTKNSNTDRKALTNMEIIDFKQIEFVKTKRLTLEGKHVKMIKNELKKQTLTKKAART